MGCLRGMVTLVAVVFVVGIIGAVVSNRPATQSAQSQPAPVARVATLDKSEAMQADRKSFIEKLIGQGVFQKIEVPGNLPRLWVRSAFYALDFDMKQKFVGVVYAYYFDGSNDTDTVRIFDSRTGKEVGSYANVQGGLQLD